MALAGFALPESQTAYGAMSPGWSQVMRLRERL